MTTLITLMDARDLIALGSAIFYSF